jgi:hypothetical protein
LCVGENLFAQATQRDRTAIGFSATPSFPATTSASCSLSLEGSITASIITGIPADRNLLIFTLAEDSTGGRIVVYPGNFIFTPSFTQQRRETTSR